MSVYYDQYINMMVMCDACDVMGYDRCKAELSHAPLIVK